MHLHTDKLARGVILSVLALAAQAEDAGFVDPSVGLGAANAFSQHVEVSLEVQQLRLCQARSVLRSGEPVLVQETRGAASRF